MGFLFLVSSDSFDGLALDDLITRVQGQPRDELALAEILRRFLPLARKIARSMTRCPTTQDDLIAVAQAALAQAVLRHQPGLPGFAAYAERFMWGASRRWNRQWEGRCTRVEFNFEAMVIEDDLSADPFGDGDTGSAVRSLAHSQQRLLYRRYVEDATLADIAAADSTSESAVSQRLRTAHTALRKLLAS